MFPKRWIWPAIATLIGWPGFCGAGTGLQALPEAQWTFAFYLAGENSLEQEQARNLGEIIAGAAGLGQTHIVVLMDRDERFGPDNPLTSWKGTRVFHVAAPLETTLQKPMDTTLPAAIGAERFEQLVLARLQDPDERRRVQGAYQKQSARYVLGNIDSSQRQDLLDLLTRRTDYLLPLRGRRPVNLVAADERTLRQFFSFVGDHFPARHYALFMAGHGSGWYGRDPSPGPASGPDRSPEYHQTLKSQALADAARWHPFDLIVMDSCLMADIESLWVLRQAADYLVLHQIETPSRGLDYTLLLQQVAGRAEWKPRDLAKAVVQAYARAFEKAPYPLSTAAFEADRIEPLAREWNRRFGRAENPMPALSAVRHLPPVPTATILKGAMVDMRAMCEVLGLGDLGTAIAGPQGAMVAHFRQNTVHSGLSIYLPRDRAVYTRTFGAYGETAWAREFPEGWIRAVAALFATE